MHFSIIFCFKNGQETTVRRETPQRHLSVWSRPVILVEQEYTGLYMPAAGL